MIGLECIAEKDCLELEVWVGFVVWWFIRLRGKLSVFYPLVLWNVNAI